MLDERKYIFGIPLDCAIYTYCTTSSYIPGYIPKHQGSLDYPKSFCHTNRCRLCFRVLQALPFYPKLEASARPKAHYSLGKGLLIISRSGASNP